MRTQSTETFSVPDMTAPISVHRTDFRCIDPKNAVLKYRPEGPDRWSGQQQTSVPIVPNKDERAAFDEVFLPHMAEAYRLAQWLTGNASDADRKSTRLNSSHVSI